VNKKQSWFYSLNKNDLIASVLSALWIAIVILFVIPYNAMALASLLKIYSGGEASLYFCIGGGAFGSKGGFRSNTC
jgi:hypothetical protein